MERGYVLGAPRFAARSRPELRPIPPEELETARAIRAELEDPEPIALARSREYASIVRALDRLELPYAIFTPPDPAALFAQPGGREVRRLLRSKRLLHAPDSLARSHSSYPRDLMHVAGDAWLINERDRDSFDESPGHGAVFSELGEGGRVLHAGSYLLHPDAILVDGRPVERTFALPETTCLAMPQPSLVSIDGEGAIVGDSAVADHLDRYGCLLTDAAGGVHLIVSHGLRIGDDVFASRLAGVSVTYHRAPPSPVPLILNLIQDDAGRILVSGGDDGMRAFLAGVTGREVHTTDVPIRTYPVFSFAGLRCLLGEVPRAFLEASATRT